MAPLIRRARPDDYAPFCSLIAQSNSYHADRLPSEFRVARERARHDDFDPLLSADDQTLLVAELGGRLVGLVCVMIRSSPKHPAAVDKRFAYIWDLIVDRTMRRRGIGRALMEGAETWTRQLGVAECRLYVFDFNESAIAFYDELGYRPLSHILSKRLDSE